jgi:hypothetical protein
MGELKKIFPSPQKSYKNFCNIINFILNIQFETTNTQLLFFNVYKQGQSKAIWTYQIF